MINWKHFDVDVNGITLSCDWWEKDFSFRYQSKFGEMSSGLHMMYMVPIVYTEEELRKRAQDFVKGFKKTEEWISETENYDWIVSMANEYCRKKKEAEIKIEELKKNKPIKSDLKSGKIEKKEYEKKMRIYHKVKEELELDLFGFFKNKMREKGLYDEKNFDGFPGAVEDIFNSMVNK